VVEVTPENKEKFEKMLNGVVFANIGTTNDTNNLEISGLNGKKIVNEAISDLKEAWQKPLRW
jgi:phosphoribosylformylglycinamidine synthase